MKITPVIHSNIQNTNNINNKQNFTGLWAKTSLSSDIDPALGVLRVQETAYYYPFEGENERIAEIYVQGFKNAYIEENTDSPRYMVNDCRLCATLPFTESDYEKYIAIPAGTRLDDKFREIHKVAQKFFLNKEHGKQKSARNINLQA